MPNLYNWERLTRHSRTSASCCVWVAHLGHTIDVLCTWVGHFGCMVRSSLPPTCLFDYYSAFCKAWSVQLETDFRVNLLVFGIDFGIQRGTQPVRPAPTQKLEINT